MKYPWYSYVLCAILILLAVLFVCWLNNEINNPTYEDNEYIPKLYIIWDERK